MRLLIAAALLVMPCAAAAQDAPRGYVVGFVGSAGDVVDDTIYSGLGAWRVNGRFHVFGEVARMRNAIGQDLADRLEVVKAGIVAGNVTSFGAEFPVVFESRVPTWYGFGGLRVHGPSRGKFSTFVEGGAGTARQDPQVHLTVNGENLDSEAAAITGLGEGRQQLAFLAGGGGGVAFQVWKRIRVEGGYRYMRIFGDAKANINRVTLGAGWTF